jgi:membrane protease subunit HflC
MKKNIWILGGIVLLGLIIALVTFTVDETDYVVVTQFGRPVRTITESGLQFKLPYPAQRVNRFDRRLQVFESRLIEFLTRDKKNIVIKFFVCWGVKDPKLFLQAVGTNMVAEQKLDDILTSKGGAAIGDFEFEDLISVEQDIRIDELNERVRTNIEEQALRDYGILVTEVGISRLALPESNAFSVYNRMRAERKAIANKYRAEGKEMASGIRAKADRDKSEILSKVYQEAQIIRGEGEAEAARIYAEAFQKDLEFYQFWRTMESYRKILDEKTTLVLSEDSELFKYLKE